jgi:peptidoglycan/xylan/chitin deacetylase (PgdA/CDA1 family)
VRAVNALGTADGSPATRTWTVDAQTIVSFTFDDGDATQYQVKDLLASRGMRATFFVNSPRIGSSGFHLTWAQIDALAADGNEIAGHTLTHADLTNPALTEAQKRAEVCDDRQDLVARGYDPVSFAYPTGASDATAQAIVRECGYLLARRVGGIASPGWCPSCGSPRAESLPAENPLVVRTPSFGTGEITLSAIQGVVTQAETTGGWLPLVFHGVCESAICGDGWVRPSTLAALFDWLAARSASGTSVKTMRAALTGADHIPPVRLDTSITDGPTGTVASRSASFRFSSTSSGSRFECKLDSGSWFACTSPKSYIGLSNGSHTFSVRARDALGNVDATPATRTWTVDTSAPGTSITGGPTGTVSSTSASFSFGATEAGASFECRLDSGSWSACTSPKAYAGLSNGSHTFSVRARDAAGNVDSTPATRTWAVDTVAPRTWITDAPSSYTWSSTAEFRFSASESGSTFECMLDSGSWSACTSPKYYSVSRGTHTFSVRAKDRAGNVDASPATYTWRRR